jgi:hypothetical protein
MKMKTLITTAPACLTAVGLLTLAAAIPAKAAAPPALQGQVIARPVTPGDKAVYALPASLEVSGGLSTVGVGTPVYLEAEVNIAIPAADITGVSWVLTNQPVGSAAALQANPMGTNVPVYEPADRLAFQVASRTLLRPDVKGRYSVTATITTASEGTTNITFTVTAGTYVGVNTCALCHSGGLIAQDMVQSWQTTAHSTIFTKGIDGNLGIGAFYSQSCLPCHTVGYDVNTNAVNGGFDDVMAQLGWVFPTVITNGNWAAVPHALQNLANIQCENCHGPGSEHASLLGDTNAPTWPSLSVTVNSGDCNQCHDAPTHHVKGTEWYSSLHALASRVPTGPSRSACVACHTSLGFLARIEGWSTTNTSFAAISCQTCHEPHGLTMPTNNPHLLRVLGNYTMPDGTVVTNAGEGSLCLECHHTRNGAAATNIANYQQGLPTWYGGSSFGVHDSPQGDMIEGINAITYGQNLPSSAHRYTVTNLCVGCHMQATASTDPSFLKAGGHTFGMSYSVVSTNGVTNTVDLVAACAQCHGPISSFDMPVEDYNGDGIIEGVQTEVQHLLDKLSTLLPNSTYLSNGNYVADGLVKSPSVKTNWPTKFLNAAYNWQFVNNDSSKGVHNAPFATGLLKASIADLSGVSAAGGLPDAWVLQYFGSLTNLNAAPNATPAGDGVPNWLKYALGLNPNVAGINIPGGVVWANGKNLVNPVVNPGDTNSIAIYTAAEVAFNTDVGTTYQIQSISSWGAGWTNVGAPIQGTGNPVSYVTPTRGNAQQFYRVVHTP